MSQRPKECEEMIESEAEGGRGDEVEEDVREFEVEVEEEKEEREGVSLTRSKGGRGSE